MLKAAVASIAFLALNALHFMRGWHHLFVSHPATRVAVPPLREGALFPRAALADALRPDPAQLFDHPPAYQSRDLMEKAQALRGKKEADAEIAGAAMRRDRARAAKIYADAELREARKRLLTDNQTACAFCVDQHEREVLRICRAAHNFYATGIERSVLGEHRPPPMMTRLLRQGLKFIEGTGPTHSHAAALLDELGDGGG